jgi:hypothetical protein
MLLDALFIRCLFRFLRSRSLSSDDDDDDDESSEDESGSLVLVWYKLMLFRSCCCYRNQGVYIYKIGEYNKKLVPIPHEFDCRTSHRFFMDSNISEIFCTFPLSKLCQWDRSITITGNR